MGMDWNELTIFAEKVVQKVLELIPDLPVYVQRNRMRLFLVEVLGLTGQFDRAKTIIAQIEEDDCLAQAIALSAIYFHSGEKADRKKAIAAMWNMDVDHEGLHGALADICAGDEGADPREDLGEAIDDIVEDLQNFRNVCLKIIVACIRHRHLDPTMRKLLNCIVKEKEGHYRLITATMIAFGQCEHALEYSRKRLPSGEMDYFRLMAMVYFVESDQMEKAHSLIPQMTIGKARAVAHTRLAMHSRKSINPNFITDLRNALAQTESMTESTEVAEVIFQIAELLICALRGDRFMISREARTIALTSEE